MPGLLEKFVLDENKEKIYAPVRLSKKDFIVVFIPHLWGVNTTKTPFCGGRLSPKASFGTAPFVFLLLI